MDQESEITEHIPNCLRWSREQRLRYFVMGVCLPMICVLGSAYPIFVFADVLFRSVYVVLAILCTVSSTGLAACCISPLMGNRNWVQTTLTFGAVVWLPIAFCVVFGSGLIALIPSVIIAGFIALCTRAILPLWPSNSRFTIRQIFWLTTLAALVCAAAAAVLQSFENAWFVLYAVGWFGVFSVPVIAFVTFAIASAEISEAKKIIPGRLVTRLDESSLGPFNRSSVQ